MASDTRSLTLKLLADTADFQKKLEAGSKDIDSIGERAGAFAVKAAAAFAAAGAAIGAFAASAVKAAAEDEAAQLKLAQTIAATTTATSAQIAAVELYIEKTSASVGVVDDELRPAYSRLVKSTNDIEEAQKLLNLALDLSAATGKPLETVTNALGKAYDGNTTALGKLGLGIDAATLKSQSFDETFNTLNTTFGDFAENSALTTQKQMERVTIALGEAKESIGAALLPVVQELTTWLLEDLVPALEAFIAGLTGQGGLDKSLTASQKTAVEWGKKVRGFIDLIIDLQDELLILGAVLAGIFVASKIAAGVTAIIALINGLIKAYNALKASAIVAGVAKAFALNPVAGVAAVAVGAAVIAGATALAKNGDVDEVKGPKSQEDYNAIAGVPKAFTREQAVTAIGGRTPKGTTAGAKGSTGKAAPEKKPEMTLLEQVAEANFIKNLPPGAFDPGRFRQAEERSIVINVNAPSVIDEQGFSNAVIDALNNSQRRSGAGGSQLID
jgi:hypothetical protein